MTKHFPGAAVEGYEALVAAMPNDAKDRHVAAAAVKAGAQVIVTSNLKDFVPLPAGLEAQSPDVFLGNLFDLALDRFIELFHQQAADLQSRAVTYEQLLERLGKVAPDLVAAIRVSPSSRRYASPLARAASAVLSSRSFPDAANRRRFFGGVLSTEAPLTARSRCLRSLSEGGVEGSRIGGPSCARRPRTAPVSASESPRGRPLAAPRSRAPPRPPPARHRRIDEGVEATSAVPSGCA